VDDPARATLANHTTPADNKFQNLKVIVCWLKAKSFLLLLLAVKAGAKTVLVSASPFSAKIDSALNPRPHQRPISDSNLIKADGGVPSFHFGPHICFYFNFDLYI
jgi:hypothetical protein